MIPTSAIVVLMTAGTHDEATLIANQLIESRLAGCVQIMPQMESIYRWDGKLERAQEFLLLAKTTQEKFEELEQQVRVLHSYDTPEIVALPVTAGSTAYLEWLTQSCGSPQSQEKP